MKVILSLIHPQNEMLCIVCVVFFFSEGLLLLFQQNVYNTLQHFKLFGLVFGRNTFATINNPLFPNPYIQFTIHYTLLFTYTLRNKSIKKTFITFLVYICPIVHIIFF